ncbi:MULTISPECIES: amino acid ABC transporter substrate-binding protein [Streptomyces]|uniref:amino acid ABC transporter substrate-binding protein n=1 Tax=Streptomyces TaxID=1883 RepID=UPI001679D085|nr:amino acid ABC transporter substrate-binding protein [Streptomyces umbrinus]MCR3728103.1 branched-chain amino acid transport system substrate-binding protein [Streptomyces umbrinus]MCX4562799.1 amino acid ABC transporter substrate-binding protein [Streptomyces phaeochromogenes]GHB35193.1 branched-chain amino acid ABC transporter substrate-binding protein [Streptomyces umbrinus]GHH36329.1 branched-chain amino acid ABC transporter substrate-binding protein [Streptomyces umbrinus]
MSTTQRLSWRVAALASATALTAAGCGSGGGSEDSPDDPITIGVSLPLTGDFSEPGKGVERGYKAWAKIVNDQGGLLGRKVELKILDDQSNADRVVSDYEQLIGRDQVDLVFGPFSTRLVVPAARVAEEYGLLFVEPAGAAPEVFDQGFKNLFYAAPAVANDHYNHLADYILALPEAERPKSVAYAAMDDPFAQGTAYGLKDKLEKGGIKTVVDEVYPPNTTDFGSIAAQIASSKADMVVGGSQYQDGVNLIVALQQLNYQPKMAAFSTAPTEPEFAKAIGDKTEGILAPTGYTQHADYPSNKEFVEKYTEQFGKAPEEDEANAYTTGQVVAAAVEAAKCASQDEECQQKLVKWLRGNEVETVVGPLKWDDKGRPQSAHMIQQWVDGEIQIVLPEEQKEADLVHPKPKW